MDFSQHHLTHPPPPCSSLLPYLCCFPSLRRLPPCPSSPDSGTRSPSGPGRQWLQNYKHELKKFEVSHAAPHFPAESLAGTPGWPRRCSPPSRRSPSRRCKLFCVHRNKKREYFLPKKMNEIRGARKLFHLSCTALLDKSLPPNSFRFLLLPPKGRPWRGSTPPPRTRMTGWKRNFPEFTFPFFGRRFCTISPQGQHRNPRRCCTGQRSTCPSRSSTGSAKNVL